MITATKAAIARLTTRHTWQLFAYRSIAFLVASEALQSILHKRHVTEYGNRKVDVDAVSLFSFLPANLPGTRSHDAMEKRMPVLRWIIQVCGLPLLFFTLTKNLLAADEEPWIRYMTLGLVIVFMLFVSLTMQKEDVDEMVDTITIAPSPVKRAWQASIGSRGRYTRPSSSTKKKTF